MSAKQIYVDPRAVRAARIVRDLDIDLGELAKPTVITKINVVERAQDEATTAQILGVFFINQWRARRAFNDCGTIAKQMRKQGIPLAEALLLLFGKPERFAHLVKV